MNRLTANLLLLFIAAIWGFAFLFQKTAMKHIGPYLFLASRSVLAVLALFPLVLREHRRSGRPAPREFWLVSIAGGLSIFFAAILQQIGIVTATITNAGFLTCIYVVLTPFLMWAVMRRRIELYVWPIVGLSLLGAWMLHGGTLGGFSQGDWLVTLSSVFWAIQILVLERAARYRRPITYTAIQFAVAGFIAAAGVLAFESDSVANLVKVWPELLFVGVFSSAFTFTVLAWALQHTPPVDAAILVSLEAIFCAVAGVLFLDERLAWLGWTGAGLMLVASILIQVVPVMRERKSQP